MKTSKRFTNAVTKLYNAFHKGELEKYNCEKCAVGSIVGNGSWAMQTFDFIDYNPERNDILNICNTGYSAVEIREIENLFMFGYSSIDKKIYTVYVYGEPKKEQQFKGLCAVVEYLCELEGIPNVMDYTSLFEIENNEPKKQLQEVF